MSETTTEGLHQKYEVRRKDGKDAAGEKHAGCEYFVLDVTHDPHSQEALKAYALACAESNPFLAIDIVEKLVLTSKITGNGGEVRTEILPEEKLELLRLRDRVKSLEVPLCIGRPTIERLAFFGLAQFESGKSLVAADDLFQHDPYQELEHTRMVLGLALEQLRTEPPFATRDIPFQELERVTCEAAAAMVNGAREAVIHAKCSEQRARIAEEKLVFEKARAELRMAQYSFEGEMALCSLERIMSLGLIKDTDTNLYEAVHFLVGKFQSADRDARMFGKQVVILNEAFDTKNRVHEQLNKDYLKVRDRLEARTQETISHFEEDGKPVYQCGDCGCFSDTFDGIRHVDGSSRGERVCPTLLDLRALGRKVLDDSEEAQCT